jgi:putative Holliday junction resolvase
MAAKIARRAAYLRGMPRYIGIDWGAVRTGLAATDRDCIIASPLKTVPTATLFDELTRLVAAEACAGFVVGMPGALVHASVGTDAHSRPGIEACVAELNRRFPSLPVHLVDEGFSSREARLSLVLGGMPKKRREEKGATDRVAAALILQRFLEGRGGG